jgi:hypothetical protein
VCNNRENINDVNGTFDAQEDYVYCGKERSEKNSLQKLTLNKGKMQIRK